MFNIKDIKYYKEPIKLMQEQLKAYIFQTTLDRRRQEYLMNEQINDIKSEVHNRLLKLENQQRLNFESISNSINTGSYYNNFETLGQRLMINQKERENLEDFMDEKFRNLKNINNNYNINTMDMNNRYLNNNLMNNIDYMNYINDNQNNHNYFG